MNAEVKNIRDLIATDESAGIAGKIVMWTSAGSTMLDAVRNVLADAGVPEEHLPTCAGLGTRLHRAMHAEATREELVRPHPSGGLQLVLEKRASGQLDYDTGLRAWVDRNDKKNPAIRYEGDATRAMRVLALVSHYETTWTYEDANDWIRETAARKLCDGVALYPRSRDHFIPAHALALWAGITRAVSISRFYDVDCHTRNTMVAQVINQIREEAKEAEAAIAGGLADGGRGKRWARSRVDQCDALVEKVRGYERALGVAMADVRASLHRSMHSVAASLLLEDE